MTKRDAISREPNGGTLEQAVFTDLVQAAGPVFFRSLFDSEDQWPIGTYETTADSNPAWVLTADGEGNVTYRLDNMGPFTLPVAVAVEIIAVVEAESTS